jgi:hypothetical protein
MLKNPRKIAEFCARRAQCRSVEGVAVFDSASSTAQDSEIEEETPFDTATVWPPNADNPIFSAFAAFLSVETGSGGVPTLRGWFSLGRTLQSWELSPVAGLDFFLFSSPFSDYY